MESLIVGFIFEAREPHLDRHVSKNEIDYLLEKHLCIIKCDNDKIQNEPQHIKTYLLSCAPNEDSDLRSLIRVFVIRRKKLCILGYHWLS